MRLTEIKILGEQTVFSDRIQVRKADLRGLSGAGKEVLFSRVKVQREDAAAVILFDEERDLFYFIRQYRYAVAETAGEYLLELVAGKIDEGEDALSTAVRETEEEAGFTIAPDQIRLLCTFYASPGYTSEIYHLFIANVSLRDRKAKGGGLEEENEFIELVEMDRTIFFESCRNGSIMDGKTLMAGIWLEKELG